MPDLLLLIEKLCRMRKRNLKNLDRRCRQSVTMITDGRSLRTTREQLGLSQAKLSELCGVPQHVLSAFELEKLELTADAVIKIADALSDSSKVQEIASRAKRYRRHVYKSVEHSPDRVALARTTPNNAEYRRELEQLWKKHCSRKTNALVGVSLFAGCGGFSLGFSAAGFAVKAFLELEPDLRTIYRGNFADAVELGGDIGAVANSQIERLKKSLKSVDVLIGGPPCQGFSLAGKRRVDDPRNALFRDYLRFVEILRPRVAVLENVRLLTSMKNVDGGLVKDDIVAEFEKHGYAVRPFEVNAKHFGVPQHRERVLFVAVQRDLGVAPSIPDMTHGDGGRVLFGLAESRSFGDACSDLPFIESGEETEDSLHCAVRHPAHVLEWLWDVPQGASAHDNADPSKRPPSGYNTTYKRQLWLEPAATVQTTFGMISGCRNVHPIATRSLTVREAARIQSFPDEFRFVGSLGAVRTGIGNAVPPLLAFRLGAHIKQMLQSL